MTSIQYDKHKDEEKEEEKGKKKGDRTKREMKKKSNFFLRYQIMYIKRQCMQT